jgi:hypothetical protein
MSDENNMNNTNTSQGSDYKIKSQYLDNIKVNEMKDMIKSGTKQSQNYVPPHTDFKVGNNSNYYDSITGSIPRYENDSVDEEIYDEICNANLETNKHITMNGYIVAPEEKFVHENCQQQDNLNNYFHIENNQQYNQEKLESIHNFYMNDVINSSNYNEDSNQYNEDLDKKYNQQRSGFKNLLSNMQAQTNFNPNFVNNNIGGLNTNSNTIYSQSQNNNQSQNMDQINNNNGCDEINY